MLLTLTDDPNWSDVRECERTFTSEADSLDALKGRLPWLAQFVEEQGYKTLVNVRWGTYTVKGPRNRDLTYYRCAIEVNR